MKLLKLLFLPTLLAVCFLLFTAAQRSDSLYSIWQDVGQPDSIRVQAYKDYIWKGYIFSNPDTALILAEALHGYAQKQNYRKATSVGFSLQGIAYHLQGNYPRALEYYEKWLAIEEKIGNKIGMTNSLNNIGVIHFDQGNYTLALVYYERALTIREDSGDKKGIASSLDNIGLIYSEQGNYSRALENYEKALMIREEIGDKKGMANSMGNIGNLYFDLKNYPRALEYSEKTLAIMKEIGNKKGVAGSLVNIGNIYKNQENYSLALEYYEKGLSISEEIGDKRHIANCLNNIGIVYSKTNYLKALSYYEKALAIREEIGDREGIVTSFNNIGMVHKKLDQDNLALKYCLKGLDLAKEIGALGRQRAACECLYDTYKKMGNTDKGLKYHEMMIVYKDSMFNEENTKKLTQISMQYEFDKKVAATKAEQEKKDAIALHELQQQKLMRNGFMGGFTVVLLFAGLFFFQRNRIGKEKARSEELLLNILPKEVAEELKSKGEAETKLIDQVTVLFTDFKGFTQMSEKVTPKELVHDLHECFSAFDDICEKYGIEKIKTIGDAYMAAGGLPSPNTTHALDVVRAALEIAGVLEKDRATKLANNQPFFEIRIGIHTGPVVAGIVGVKKFQYDIWGDTVNTASRMESSGEVGKVNISEVTYALVKDNTELTFASRGRVKAKGKGELAMYFVDQVEKI